VFELGSDGEKLEIAANSATAMAYGLQWYLKRTLHTQTDWDDHELQLPDKLSKVDKRERHKRSAKFSYYQNVCTVSYSSWTWGWDKWEKHIDWMALNGRWLVLAVLVLLGLLTSELYAQESTCRWRLQGRRRSGRTPSRNTTT
jgi:alpha-N-acetylglucosaminidase